MYCYLKKVGDTIDQFSIQWYQRSRSLQLHGTITVTARRNFSPLFKVDITVAGDNESWCSPGLYY